MPPQETCDVCRLHLVVSWGDAERWNVEENFEGNKFQRQGLGGSGYLALEGEEEGKACEGVGCSGLETFCAFPQVHPALSSQ